MCETACKMDVACKCTTVKRVVSLEYGGHVFQRGQNRTLKLIMGVDTQTWRIKIGTFIHPRKCRNAMKCTRQGDVSSPLLFTLFINDLCTLLREKCPDGIFITGDVPDLFCLMFADDIANCAETRIKVIEKQ